MSIMLMNMAFYAASITPTQKIVLLALADHASDDGKSIYPTIHRLEIKTSLSERTVQRVLRDLEKLDLIQIVRPAAQHRANEYEINVRRLQEMQSPGVSYMHPATDPGVSSARPGVSLSASRGVTVTPKPPLTTNTTTTQTQGQGEPPPVVSHLTEGQTLFLSAFGAKRFKNHLQAEAVKNLEQVYGIVRLTELVEWAAKQGMSLGHALLAVESALKKPKTKVTARGSPPNGNGQAREIVKNEDGTFYG